MSFFTSTYSIRKLTGSFLIAMLFFSLFGNKATALAASLCVNPGGTGSCYATIQGAINAASPGDTINVAAGTYTEQVTINKSLDLIGAGEASTRILAPAVRSGTVTHNLTIHDYLLAAYATSGTIDVRIHGFTFDLNNQNKTVGTARLDGVFIRDVKNAGGTKAGLFSSTIHNFAATPDYESWGVAVYGDSLLTLNDNNVSDYTRDGLLVAGDGGPGPDPIVMITNNTFTGSPAPLNGISVQDVSEGAITGNTVTGHTRSAPWAGGGIILWASTGVPITDNHVNDNFYGIDLEDGTHDVTVSGNELTDNIKRGISINNSDNNTISGNTITGPASGTDDTTIGLANTSTGNMIGGPTLADGNIITMATAGTGNLYAIYMQADVGAGSNTIKFNTITGGRRAIQFDGPPGITGTTTISKNKISGQEFGGILAYNNGDLMITNNKLTNSVRPIEFFGPVNVTITGNTIDGSTYSAINLGAFSGSAMVSNNIISGITNYNGIWAQTSGAGLTISENTIFDISGGGGSGRGIQIDSSADNVIIDGNEIFNITGFSGIVIDTGATGASIINNYVHNNEQGIVVNEQTAQIEGNRILDNRWGIDLNNAGATFILVKNSIIGNDTNPADSYGLAVWAGAAIAEDNRWGDASGPYDPQNEAGETTEVPPCGNVTGLAMMNVDGAGDLVIGNVDYCPWSENPTAVTEPVTTPVAQPATGFAQNQVTWLPKQTVAYTSSDLTLEIPRLSVSLDIVGVPQTDGTWNVTWLGDQAGWLNGTAFPTYSGNSVITGHVWNALNLPGPFFGLDTLQFGDKVIVHGWGATYTYEVRQLLQVSPTNVSALMKHQDLPWITLVTCKGFDDTTGEYNYRLLVRAVLVDVK